jgi:glycosyltransferase involved in cell wall biosynthesis
MHVLLVSQYYPPETGALAARAGDHARRWAAAGARVTVVAERPSYPTGVVPPAWRWRLFARGVEDGVDVLRVPAVATAYTSAARRVASYVSFAASAVAAAGLFGRAPDVVLGTSPPLTAALAAAALAARFRAPFVLELRDLWPEAFEALGAGAPGGIVGGLRGMARALYACAAQIVVVTDGMRDALGAQGVAAERVAVVPNGVDVARFRPDRPPAPLRAALGVPDGALLVGHVGTMGLGQDLETLVAALPRLRGPAAGAHVALVGEGARRRRLTDLAARLAPGRCHVLPPRPYDEVPGVLTALDVALVSSRWAPAHACTIPSKLYDALACGRPVLLAGHGAAADLVRAVGAGEVVPPGDAAALAAALERLAADPAARARHAAAGPAWVRAHRDRDRLAATLLDLLERASGRGPR